MATCYGFRVKTQELENGARVYQDINFGIKVDDPKNPGEKITIEERLSRLETIKNYTFDYSFDKLTKDNIKPQLADDSGNFILHFIDSDEYGYDAFTITTDSISQTDFNEAAFIECYYYQGNVREMHKIPDFSAKIVDGKFEITGRHWGPCIFRELGDLHITIVIG